MIKIKVDKDNSSFDFLKSKLKPRDNLFQGVWIGETINPDVSERLIEIADSVLESMDIDVKVKDIILTGSLAGYNWHDLSDIDLHIILNFSDIDENVDLVKRMKLTTFLFPTRRWNSTFKTLQKLMRQTECGRCCRTSG